MSLEPEVVLESLLPSDWVRKLEMEAEACPGVVLSSSLLSLRFLDLPQEGLIPQPLRAGRTATRSHEGVQLIMFDPFRTVGAAV